MFTCCFVVCHLLSGGVRVMMFDFFFFFQAEDGIRDADVTGVQTCALPIWHFSTVMYFQYSVPYEYGYFRVISPTEKKIRMIYPNGEAQPSTSTIGNTTNIWEFHKMAAVQYENNTPAWYSSDLKVMLTDFKSWDDLLPWTTKYYNLDTRQLQKLKSEVGDYFLAENKKATALNIIRFIQDEIRYLGFEDGMHSHQPHLPLQVFQQRFGDCKDKSMLLCALMACYNIEAYPVLVNTSLGEH